MTADGLTVDSTTGFSWLPVSTAGAKVGAIGTGTGLIINTPSVNSSYGSGLAIDGSYASSLSSLNIKAFGAKYNSYGSELNLFTSDDTSLLKRQTIASNGDISFYEDTGTTPKFFWDASAERLGIGTSSPTDALSVDGQIKLFGNDGQLKFNDGSAIKGGNNYGDIRIQTDRFRVYNEAGSNLAMNIDSSGNVGIGTTSPSKKLHIQDGQTELLVEGTNNSVNSTVAGVSVKAPFYRKAGLTIYDESDSEDFFIGRPYGSTNQFAIINDGSERMRIDSSGRVGIGTSSPSEIFEVSTATANTAYLKVGTINNGSSHTVDSDIAGLEFYSGDTSGSGAGVKGSIRYKYGSSSGATTHMTFHTASVSGGNDVERMRIDSSGKCGYWDVVRLAIKLHVTSASTGNIASFFEAGTGNTNRIYIGADSGLSYIDATAGVGSTALGFKVASTERLRIDSAGNVGIGTTSINNKLALADTADCGIQLTKTGSISVRVAAVGGAMAFGVDGSSGNTERMRIDSSGNVGIGTTSPSGYRLNVSKGSTGNIAQITDGVANTFIISSDANTLYAGNANNYPVAFVTNNTERMRIDSSGNLGIGTSSPNSYTGQTTLNINSAGVARLDLDIGDTMQGYLLAESGYTGLFTPSGSNSLRLAPTTQNAPA